MSKKRIVLCDYCGWKKVCDPDESGLHELKSDTLSNKKFRCPGCGRAISARPFKDPQGEADRKSQETKMEEENKKWIEEHIQFQEKFLKERDDEQ
jgi:hypothetical protein